MSKKITMEFGDQEVHINLPVDVDILSMKAPEPLSDPASKINEALVHSINSPGLAEVIEQKKEAKPDAKAVVVVSDNTRPVPYRGEKGILWPVIKKLLDGGISRDNILILVATGTHRLLSEEEFKEMIDPRVFEMGVKVENHNCKDKDNLVYLGKTSRESEVYINQKYIEADIKILTGLVESHFMAGTSGGRKSVCPGLIGEKSTYIFHGAEILDSPEARDLVLEGNPCHEESLEVAKMAGVDYIINVTLDHEFNLTGVFAGELEEAHKRAVERIKEYVAVPFKEEYDIVITHAGFVGLNHYQLAKAGVVAAPVLKPHGKLIMAANTTDDDPVGSPMYRTVLHLLTLFGPDRFMNLILSPDWEFIPEQWQVQMWTKLFKKIGMDNYIYYSPRLTAADCEFLPGINGNMLLPEDERYQTSLDSIASVIKAAVVKAVKDLEEEGLDEIKIAYLADGPYSIPVKT